MFPLSTVYHSLDSLRVNYRYFITVFNNHCNILFGRPAADVCIYCVRYQTKINISKGHTYFQTLKTELKVYTFKVSQFHKINKVS